MQFRVGWGGRIRTCDRGAKGRCLTTWPRPRVLKNLPYDTSAPLSAKLVMIVIGAVLPSSQATSAACSMPATSANTVEPLPVIIAATAPESIAVLLNSSTCADAIVADSRLFRKLG